MSTSAETPSVTFPLEAPPETLMEICVREADIGLPPGGRFYRPSKAPSHDEALALFDLRTNKWLASAKSERHASVIRSYRKLGFELLGLHAESTINPSTLNKKTAETYGVEIFLPLAKGGYLEVQWGTNCRTWVERAVHNEWVRSDSRGRSAYLHNDKPMIVVTKFINARWKKLRQAE